MKNRIYLLVFILFSLTIFAQKKSLQITNKASGEVKVFTENERIKIRTLNHKKWVGHIKIIDSIHFSVKDHIILIDSLQSIKKHPKTMERIETIVLSAGLSLVATSLIAAAKGSNKAILLFALGSGTAVGAGIMESINPNYIERKWEFKIIEN